VFFFLFPLNRFFFLASFFCWLLLAKAWLQVLRRALEMQATASKVFLFLPKHVHLISCCELS
jgi:hypothetical protein